MKIFATLLRTNLAIGLVLLAGCENGQINLSFKQQPETVVENTVQPWVVATIQPDQEGVLQLANLVAQFQSGTESTVVRVSRELKRFLQPALRQRTDRAMVGVIYAAENGIPEPLLYIPVESYDQFVNDVDQLYSIHRAVATRVRVGHYEMILKQVGDYAVFGTSAEAINYGPQDPESFADCPGNSGAVVKLQLDNLSKKELAGVCHSVNSWLGESASQALQDSSSVSLDLEFDRRQKPAFQLTLKPKANQVDSCGISATAASSVADIPLTQSQTSDGIILELTPSTEQLERLLSDVRPVFNRAFDRHIAVIAYKATKGGKSIMPQIRQTEGVYIFDGAMGDTSGGGGGRRRG
jgi:hypothetical protein